MDMSVERIREIMRVAQEPVSMETPIGPEEDSRLMDFIKDDDALAPDEAALKTITNEDIDAVLKTLTPREEAVIRLRFGLYDGRCHDAVADAADAYGRGSHAGRSGFRRA